MNGELFNVCVLMGTDFQNRKRDGIRFITRWVYTRGVVHNTNTDTGENKLEKGPNCWLAYNTRNIERYLHEIYMQYRRTKYS